VPSYPSHQPLLDAAVDRAPVGMAIIDDQLRYVRVNELLAEINGVPVAEHLGRRVDEVLPRELAELLVPLLRDVLASGRSHHGIELRRGEAGDARRMEASYFPVSENGGVSAVGVVVLDTTARESALQAEREARVRAERAEARSRYLARASTVLGSSLDLNATLQSVADLAVPDVADWAFVELVQGNGSIKRVAWAHADPELAQIAHAYDARYPLRRDDEAGSARVVRTGTPELVEEIPEAFFDTVAHDPEQLRILTGMGFRSYVIVPLIARGHVLGDLALAYSASGRRYGSEDLDMLQALADACAMAIDNARLFGEQEATARTLQHSLLPPELPEIPGVELAARYRPFGRATEVGGDFYDVFGVDGHWVLAIGDVVGKGTAAAMTTALLRHTLRAAAPREPGPAAALSRLDAALLDGEDRPSSAVCALLSTSAGGAEVVLASAGHPPPLVRRADGRVEFSVKPGTLLGAVEDAPPLPEATIRLAPGDVLVLYTDGVTEARVGDGQLGEAGLVEILERAAPSAAAVADAVEQGALAVQEGRQRDDIAVLAVGVPR
jgi:PAS domain S-box-containing protein